MSAKPEYRPCLGDGRGKGFLVTLEPGNLRLVTWCVDPENGGPHHAEGVEAFGCQYSDAVATFMAFDESLAIYPGRVQDVDEIYDRLVEFEPRLARFPPLSDEAPFLFG